MTRGRCDSLRLHRRGLSPLTSCRSPGAPVHTISHGRYVAFQMAEVAVPRLLFAEILRLIAELRPPPIVSSA
jgi:hypothetical protein